jgi:hypothetical protein
MKAIETHYAGCRFRSRIEARWAVFFDHLSIEWEYEAQGYTCSARLTGEEEPIDYLPDFWLPTQGIFAEVKGSLSANECVRLLNVAASLSSNDGDGCGTGPNTVVLGPVPSPRAHRLPPVLHMHKGALHASPWNPLEAQSRCWHPDYVNLADDYLSYGELFQESDIPGAGATLLRTEDAHRPRVELPPWEFSAILTADFLLSGFRVPGKPRRVTNAYTKARSARFEHGERG